MNRREFVAIGGTALAAITVRSWYLAIDRRGR